MYVRALADTSAVIVARGEGFWVQTFSPDGKLLAFVTGFPGMLKVVSIDGASERTLVASKVFATGLAWSDDGWIYFGQGERYGRRLMRVRAAGGAPELVAEPDSTRGEVAFGQFSVMPGGRTLLLTVRFTSGEPQVATLDLRTHTVTRLVKGLIAGYITSGQLVVAQRNGELQMGTFDAGRAQLTSSLVTVANGLETANNLNAPISVAPSGSILYQARVPDGQIVWVTRDGHETPVDPKWHGRFEAFALSPDGKQLALGIVTGARTELWVKAFPDGPLGRVFEGTNTAYRPVWFPDGKTIGFTGDVFGPLESFTVQADASAPPERLISDPRSVDELVVSRDGRWIVYRQGSGTDRHLYLMARGVDSTGRPLFPHAASAQSFAPAISPDGKWIAYTGDESGRNEVYLRPFPNAADAKYIVSRNGGAEPVWAHSGRELFFRDNNNVLVAASLALGATANVTALTPLFPTARYFLESRHSAYDVSADDRRFLFATDSSLAVTPQIHFTTNLAAIYRARAAR
jgi:serine/threonine-protein kinase